jgi:hypothetical protein
MTIIEVSPSEIYLSTTDRSELLELIAWIQKNYDRMESRDQNQVTIMDFRAIEPPAVKEPK